MPGLSTTMTQLRSRVMVPGALAATLVLGQIGLAAPAMAAPGDASGTALQLALGGEVGGVAFVTADAAVASVDAPPDEAVTAVDVAAAVSGLVGAGLTNGTASASATSSASASEGTSRIDGLAANVLGQPITATVLSGRASCPVGGTPSAATVVAGLSVFGSAVTATVNGPAVSVSSAVTVPGITDAMLVASVRTRIESTTATTATATALEVALTVTGSAGGLAVSIPLGSVVAGAAACTTPTAVAPTVTGLTPPNGPVGGGTTVTITGTGFTPGATTVDIGGITVPATDVTVTSPTTLTFATPAHAAGPVDVTVSTAAGTTDAQTFTYLAAPSQTGLTPPSGLVTGGTTVTITGTAFVPGATSVTIGGTTVPATEVDVTSATSLSFATPAHSAGPVAVTVTTAGGTTAPQGFTYEPIPAPTTADITPSNGPVSGGTDVTVTGTGFVPGQTTVAIGGATVPATEVTVTSPTTLTFATPPHAAGAVEVTVTTPGGTSAPQPFTYTPEPTLDGLTPDSGSISGGEEVTITGTGFVAGQTSVTIGGVDVPVSDVTVDGSTRLTFTTPAHAAGPVAVTVTTPGGTTEPQTFTYLATAEPAPTDQDPSITDLSPSAGPTEGGTEVTLTGTGFVPGQTSVTIGGNRVPADEVTVTSPTSLTFRTPAHGVGEVDVVVTTPEGASDAAAFTYERDEPYQPGGDGDSDGSGSGSGSGGPDAGEEEPTSSPEGVLAYTGADVRTQVLGGLALLVAGLLLLATTRKRPLSRQR